MDPARRLTPVYLNYMKVVGVLEGVHEEFDSQNASRNAIRTSIVRRFNVESVSEIEANDIKVTSDSDGFTVAAVYDHTTLGLREFEAGRLDNPIWSGAWWASGQRPDPQLRTGQVLEDRRRSQRIVAADRARVAALEQSHTWMEERNAEEIYKVGLHATPLLESMSEVVVAWQLLRHAEIALALSRGIRSYAKDLNRTARNGS